VEARDRRDHFEGACEVTDRHGSVVQEEEEPKAGHVRQGGGGEAQFE
jgi:hypothetical protein